MLQVTVEAWMTDLYRSAHWWIELPNVEDVGDVNRGRLKVKAVPLGFTGSSLVSVENQSQGRMRLEGIRLALFSSGGSSDLDGEMISGTPPAWFARVWNCTRSTSVEHPPSGPHPDSRTSSRTQRCIFLRHRCCSSSGIGSWFSTVLLASPLKSYCSWLCSGCIAKRARHISSGLQIFLWQNHA